MAARRDESDAAPAPSSGAGHSRWRSWALGVAVIVIAGMIAITGLLWSRTSDLQNTVATMQHDARVERAGRGAAAGTNVSDASAIKLLTTCVNSYMKTIGVWSKNVNDRYNYNYC